MCKFQNSMRKPLDLIKLKKKEQFQKLERKTATRSPVVVGVYIRVGVIR